MSTLTPVFRTFTREESSAIHKLHIEHEGYIEVTYHSNTERAYGFDSNPEFCIELADIISYDDLKGISLGGFIDKAKKDGNMTRIEEV
jgi:hypothetical protein